MTTTESPGALPNFLIIGAPKSGTTSLYAYLKQHPQVFMSPSKEPGFFLAQKQAQNSLTGSGHPVADLREYMRLFGGAREERALGEATTKYMYSVRAAEAIRAALPNVKLIAMLREPVERANSHYYFRRQLRTESLPTRELAFAKNEQYIEYGLYFKHLAPYYEVFGKDRIQVHLFDDLVRDPDGLLEDVFHFLGVDPSMRVRHDTIHNRTSAVRSDFIEGLFGEQGAVERLVRHVIPKGIKARLGVARTAALQSFNRGKVPPVTDALRRKLAPAFSADMDRLEALIGKPLDRWRRQ